MSVGTSIQASMATPVTHATPRDRSQTCSSAPYRPTLSSPWTLPSGQEIWFPLHTNRVSSRHVRAKVEGVANSGAFNLERTIQIPPDEGPV